MNLLSLIPLTPLLYFTGGVLCGLVALSAYISYQKSHNRAIFYLSLTFLLLCLHSLALSIPGLMNIHDLRMIGGGYIVGTFFLYALLLTALKVQTSLNRGFVEKHSFVINTIVIGVGVTALWLEITDFRFPVVGAWGTIFWNTTPIATWLIGLTALFYGLFWADFFQQTGRIVRGFAAKLKMLILSIDGVVLGVAGLLVFTSHNAVLTVIGHSLFVFASLLSLLLFVFRER